jgi:uncharacterized protein YcbK (DUF882 family)
MHLARIRGIFERPMDRRLFLSLAAGGAVWPAAARALPRPPQLRRLDLVNPHTGETFRGPYRDGNGPIAGAMAELNLFLRDFHSGKETVMDIAVVDFLADVLAAVGAAKATILSAYRTRETNEMLARTIFGVAENSQHIEARALDITLDGNLAEAMQAARAMRRGGVGWYPHSHFIHIDTGPVRNWTLDGAGFADLLLFDGQRLRFPAAHGPLTVDERIELRRRLARAEFLARVRSLGVNP